MQLGDVSSSNLFFGQVHADDVNQLLYDYPARIENPRGPSHPHSTTKELVRRLSTQSRRSSHSRRSDRKPKPSRRVSSSSSHFVQQAPHSRHSRLRPSQGNRDSPRRHSGSAVEHRHNSSGDVCGSSAPHSSSYSPLKDKRGGHRRTGTDQSKRRHHGHHSHHRKRHTQMMRNGSHNDGHNSPAEDPKNPHATNHSNNKGDVERLDDHEQRRRQAAQPQKPEVDEETNGNADENAPNGAAPANGANGKAPEGKSIPKLAHTNIEVGMRLKRWMIVSRIGAGSFGETFAGVEVSNDAFMESVLTVTPEAKEFLANLPTNPPLREVCIKVEQQNKNVLRLESLAIKRLQCCPQIARYFGSGSYAGTNFLVMERLGPNLADLRRRTPHGTFNIYTTLVAGISCLTAIRGVHDQGIVHRDIKPSNFVIGLPGSGAETTCFLIDFGLARRFRRGTGDIRPPRENAGFRGTSRYAALNSHLHKDLGRVDDLWSLLFMLVEFATGTLPWRKCKEKDDIGKCKAESITPHLVRNLPREFQPFLQHLQGLKYEDEPDYDLLLALLHRSMERRGYSANKPVDWLMDPEQIANEELLARPTPVAVAPVSPPATQPARMLPAVEAVVGPANPVVVAAAEPQEAPHASGVPTPAEPEPHRQPTHVVERASDVGEARKPSAAAPPTVAATSSSPQQQPHSSTRRLQPPTQEEVAHSALAANPGRESDTNVQISGTSAVDEEDGDFSPCERPAKLVAQRTKTGDAVSAASDAAAASIPAASSSPPPKHFGADPKPKPNKLAKDGCGCNCTVM